MIRPSSVALAVLTLTNVAHADLVEDPCACSAAKPGFFRRDKLTGDWDEHRDNLEKEGVTIQATYSLEEFAAPHLAKNFVTGGLFVTSLDIELNKLMATGEGDDVEESHLGQIHASALAIHGGGLSAELDDVYGISGNSAPNDARAFELWYEQPLKSFKIRAGLLSADQEYVLAAHSTALLNATFGIISQLSYNVLGPVYPVATPGASARMDSDLLTVKAAIYDGDQKNKHGLPTNLFHEKSYLAIGEVELAKLLKLGSWHHSSTNSDGYYAILDHQVDGRVGAFARVSYSPGKAVTSYIDTGIRIGPGPLRPKDFMGAGIAFVRTRPDEVSIGGAQIVYELTYQAQFGWLTIQPDFQLLAQRGRTTPIGAVRVTIVL